MCRFRHHRVTNQDTIGTTGRILLAMKAYHPWQVCYVNGEFRAYGIEGNLIDYSRRE